MALRLDALPVSNAGRSTSRIGDCLEQVDSVTRTHYADGLHSRPSRVVHRPPVGGRRIIQDGPMGLGPTGHQERESQRYGLRSDHATRDLRKVYEVDTDSLDIGVVTCVQFKSREVRTTSPDQTIERWRRTVERASPG